MRALLVLLAALSGCAIKRTAADPLPTASAPTPAAPPLIASTQTVQAAPPPPPPAPEPKPGAKRARRPAPSPAPAAAPAKAREWGFVAITSAIVSPSQLIGAEVAFSTAFKRLPVFPERLTFDVGWGMLSVGEATMNVERIVLFNGRPAYHVVNEARSNAFCDTFHPVRDLNESWIDARTLTSLGYSKKLREGKFFRDEWVLYDRDEGRYVGRITNRDGSFRVRTGTIPASVQDVLSTFYYVRANPVPDGGEVVVDVNTPENWPLAVKVLKREKVKGRPAVLMEPVLRKEGLFITKGKSLRLWLSDDGERRPLLMKAEVFFGHITASLREML